MHNNWFIDKESEYRWIYHRVKRRVLSKKTKFQQVELIDTYNFGLVIILDNKIQSAEADEFIYHEAIVHPAMVTHPDPKTVLILGGGEGATLREVLKHPTVKKVVMVDIDEEFVRICEKHLKKWHGGSFNDRRAELIFTDAREYVKETEHQFDVIIADISDPVEEGPGKLLYTREFYSSIKKTLAPEGIFVTHATDIHYIPHKSIFPDIFRTFIEIFPKVDFYYEYIPSFSSLWAYAVGSLKYRPSDMSPQTISSRLKKRRLGNLSYYDQKTHGRLFHLPICIRKLLAPG
ncbi:MAG: polyamine aminopropyltransferase [Thermodesulfovibrionales bacterium]|nr:polyamine aminopropyltransferase [Thermodesulfovibrionales bacterium]